MAVWFYLGPRLCDLAVLIDQISDSRDTPVLPSVHALLLPRAILLRHLVIHVRKQREVQPVLRREFLMSLFSVRRNTEHNRAELFDGADVISKRASFDRATWRQVFRIKIEDDFLAFEVRELYLIAIAIVEHKLRSLITC